MLTRNVINYLQKDGHEFASNGYDALAVAPCAPPTPAINFNSDPEVFPQVNGEIIESFRRAPDTLSHPILARVSIRRVLQRTRPCAKASSVQLFVGEHS